MIVTTSKQIAIVEIERVVVVISERITIVVVESVTEWIASKPRSLLPIESLVFNKLKLVQSIIEPTIGGNWVVATAVVVEFTTITVARISVSNAEIHVNIVSSKMMEPDIITTTKLITQLIDSKNVVIKRELNIVTEMVVVVAVENISAIIKFALIVLRLTPIAGWFVAIIIAGSIRLVVPKWIAHIVNELAGERTEKLTVDKPIVQMGPTMNTIGIELASLALIQLDSDSKHTALQLELAIIKSDVSIDRFANITVQLMVLQQTNTNGESIAIGMELTVMFAIINNVKIVINKFEMKAPVVVRMSAISK